MVIYISYKKKVLYSVGTGLTLNHGPSFQIKNLPLNTWCITPCCFYCSLVCSGSWSQERGNFTSYSKFQFLVTCGNVYQNLTSKPKQTSLTLGELWNHVHFHISGWIHCSWFNHRPMRFRWDWLVLFAILAWLNVQLEKFLEPQKMVYPHLNYGQGAALLTLLLLNNHQDILESRETLLILEQYLYLKLVRQSDGAT